VINWARKNREDAKARRQTRREKTLRQGRQEAKSAKREKRFLGPLGFLAIMAQILLYFLRVCLRGFAPSRFMAQRVELGNRRR
jgi:hypothetical protein